MIYNFYIFSYFQIQLNSQLQLSAVKQNQEEQKQTQLPRVKPSIQKINELTNRFSHLNDLERSTRDGELVQINTALKNVDTHLAEITIKNRDKFAQLRDLCGTVQTQLQTHSQNRENNDTQQTKQIQLVESQLQILLNNEKAKRQDLEDHVLKLIQQRVDEIKSSLDAEINECRESAQEQKQEIQKQIDEANKQIEDDRKFVRDKQDEINKYMNTEFNKMKDSITQEKKARNQQMEVIYDQLTDFVKKFTEQLQDDRQQREEYESQLIQVLEDVCDKTARMENLKQKQ